LALATKLSVKLTQAASAMRDTKTETLPYKPLP